MAAAAATEDAGETNAVVVDGLSFRNWPDFLGSEYFKASGLRCGTPDRATRQMLYGIPTRGVASDCSSNSTNPTAAYDPTVLYEIPVVVHILMDTACGQGAISDALVSSQIDILNEDLLALMGTPGGNGTDAQIRFVLANEDANGSPTTGITRDCNTTWFNDNGSYWNTLAWDPNRFLNIYTNTADGNLGYVPFLPADGQAGTAEDRVVVLWTSFGRNGPIGPPYDQGRTSTHEVGHYLGLEHTFNEGCASATAPGCYSDGDLICDTNAEQNPAGSQCDVGDVSSCGSVDPTDNYMDYSDDLCMDRFTVEQIRRIRCSLQNYRPNLYTTGGGGNTAPVVSITAPAGGASFPEGTSIAFSGSATDAEDGNLTAGLSWTSNLGGSLGSGGSFSATLSVGTHTVTAAVTDSGGLPGSSSITVTVTADCSRGVGGLDETFEGGAGAWTTSGLWHLVSSSSCGSPGYSSPVSSMYYGQDGSCDYDTNNTTTGDLISPQISGLSASSNLTFDYFRQVEDESGDSYDTTEVAVSVVGSSSWATVWSRDSTDASENAWTSSGVLSLAAYAGQSIQVRFRFDSVDEVNNDFTGWLIDDVVVTGDCGGGNTAPQVTITSPANGSSFAAGTSITFTGSATDAEDGDLTASLNWTSNLDGDLGSGGSRSATLSVGTHTVTAAVTDSGGLPGSAAITVTVMGAGGFVFSDGFESGDLDGWSSSE